MRNGAGNAAAFKLLSYRKLLYALLLIITLFIFTSCSSSYMKYSGIKALNPEPDADFENYVKVDSLKPTFRWSLIEESSAQPDYYEFVIWPLSVVGLDVNQFQCDQRYRAECYLIVSDTSKCNVLGELYTEKIISGWSGSIYGSVICGGNQPYYVREVKGNSHTIERELSPKTKYVWTVKPVWENGKKIGERGFRESYAETSTYMVLVHERKSKKCKKCAFTFETP